LRSNRRSTHTYYVSYCVRTAIIDSIFLRILRQFWEATDVVSTPTTTIVLFELGVWHRFLFPTDVVLAYITSIIYPTWNMQDFLRRLHLRWFANRRWKPSRTDVEGLFSTSVVKLSNETYVDTSYKKDNWGYSNGSWISLWNPFPDDETVSNYFEKLSCHNEMASSLVRHLKNPFLLLYMWFQFITPRRGHFLVFVMTIWPYPSIFYSLGQIISGFILICVSKLGLKVRVMWNTWHIINWSITIFSIFPKSLGVMLVTFMGYRNNFNRQVHWPLLKILQILYLMKSREAKRNQELPK